MRNAKKSGLVVVLAIGLTHTMAGSAQAEYRTMRNNPSYYNDAYCSGDVIMNYFITDRTDISSATYYDEFKRSDGSWARAAASWTLYDSNTNDYTMITNLSATRVRVRANHYVTTHQGPSCSD